MIAGAKHRILRDRLFHCKIPVHKVGSAPGERIVVERRSIKLYRRIDYRWFVCRDGARERIEAVFHAIGNPITEKVRWHTEVAAKSLDAVIGIAIFARR